MGGDDRLRGAVLGLGLRREPPSAQKQRFGLPDVLGETAVPVRLTGLLLQGIELPPDGRDNIVEPGEVFLGCGQSILFSASRSMRAS